MKYHRLAAKIQLEHLIREIGGANNEIDNHLINYFKLCVRCSQIEDLTALQPLYVELLPFLKRKVKIETEPIKGLKREKTVKLFRKFKKNGKLPSGRYTCSF